MTMIFKPSVWKTGDGAVTEMPKPTPQVTIGDSWDSRQSKVPLADGITFDGLSRNGTEIRVSGQFGLDTSGTYLGEENMFARYETIRTKIDISADSDKYEFFLFHDTVEPLYRKFKSCVTRSLDLSLGDDDRIAFVYNLVIVAEDPVIYSTAPGA